MSLSGSSELEKDFFEQLTKVRTPEGLESLRRKLIGRGGTLDAALKGLKDLPLPERQAAGKSLNLLKEKVEEALRSRRDEFESARLARELDAGREDPTLPADPFTLGILHPITRVLDEITEIFLEMGFGIAEGPEIETDENNFEALNFPPNHPARDMHDTFYLESGKDWTPRILRTHTSPVQIRQMRGCPPPVRVIAPGKVYRHEAIDATHSSVFHQIEGLAVGRDISFADLKGTLEIFCRRYFGERVLTRFRPSYFPFVEPGAEMDISCAICGGHRRKSGSACPVCKGSGWLEMLGAGMVHPNVFRSVGYDPEAVTGYAFGMGIERIAMVRYGINDMRLFYENHLDFLGQFRAS